MGEMRTPARTLPSILRPVPHQASPSSCLSRQAHNAVLSCAWMFFARGRLRLLGGVLVLLPVLSWQPLATQIR